MAMMDHFMEPMTIQAGTLALSPSKKEQGFTLIETLISLVILAFGLLSIASLISYSVAANFENRVDMIGTSLAVQMMEQLKAQPVNTLPDGGCALDSLGNIDYLQAPVTNYFQTVSGMNNQTYDIRWNISTSNGLRKIVVAAGRVGGTNRAFMSNILKPVNIKCLKQR